jgi:uncharacterized membrane protein
MATSLFAFSANAGAGGSLMVYITLTSVAGLCVGASMLIRTEWTTRASLGASALH